MNKKQMWLTDPYLQENNELNQNNENPAFRKKAISKELLSGSPLQTKKLASVNRNDKSNTGIHSKLNDDETFPFSNVNKTLRNTLRKPKKWNEQNLMLNASRIEQEWTEKELQYSSIPEWKQVSKPINLKNEINKSKSCYDDYFLNKEMEANFFEMNQANIQRNRIENEYSGFRIPSMNNEKFSVENNVPADNLPQPNTLRFQKEKFQVPISNEQSLMFNIDSDFQNRNLNDQSSSFSHKNNHNLENHNPEFDLKQEQNIFTDENVISRNGLKKRNFFNPTKMIKDSIEISSVNVAEVKNFPKFKTHSLASIQNSENVDYDYDKTSEAIFQQQHFSKKNINYENSRNYSIFESLDESFQPHLNTTLKNFRKQKEHEPISMNQNDYHFAKDFENHLKILGSKKKTNTLEQDSYQKLYPNIQEIDPRGNLNKNTAAKKSGSRKTVNEKEQTYTLENDLINNDSNFILRKTKEKSHPFVQEQPMIQEKGKEITQNFESYQSIPRKHTSLRENKQIQSEISEINILNSRNGKIPTTGAMKKKFFQQDLQVLENIGNLKEKNPTSQLRFNRFNNNLSSKEAMGAGYDGHDKSSLDYFHNLSTISENSNFEHYPLANNEETRPYGIK